MEKPIAYKINAKKAYLKDGTELWILENDKFLIDQAPKNIKEHKGPLDVVVDIGAHIGIVSIAAAKLGAKVYAFEPSELNIQILTRNIIENKLTNKITVIPMAVTNHSGDSLPLFMATNMNSSGQRSLVFKMDGDFPIESMATTISLKDLLIRVFQIEEKIDYLKCDIEGGEWILIEEDPELKELVSKVGFIEMSVHPLGDSRYFSGIPGDYVQTMERWLESCVPGRWCIPWGTPTDRDLLIQLGGGK